jgi:hypothetical protein
LEDASAFVTSIAYSLFHAFFFLWGCFVAEKGQEDVVSNLNCVDVQKSLTRWNKGKVLATQNGGR